MAANRARAQATQAYIAELEALIAEWEEATDPESRWVLRLMAQALNEARAAMTPQPSWLKSKLH